MELDDIIKKRKSIRKYSPKEVSFDKVILLLNAAHQAPTSGNLQDFRFIVVNDKVAKNKIAEYSLKQYWMNSASLFIVVCSDIERLKSYYKDIAKDYSLQNSAAAAMLIILKSIDLGLSSCWVQVFNSNAVSRVLNLPENIIPQIIITIGYKDEEPLKKKQVPLSRISFFNKYGNRVADIKNWAKVKYSDKIKKLIKK